MPTPPAQTYATHRRLPLFLILVTLIVLAEAVRHAVLAVWHGFAWDEAWQAVVFLAITALILELRSHMRRLQDRIIRGEMRLRLATLLPAERQADIVRLELRHLIALRFASDGELPGLVARVLAGELADPDAVKRAVVAWQPDHCRV